MATNSISLLGLLHKLGADKDIDFLREAVQVLSQAIIELEASEKIGAAPYERSANRTTHRNGYRDRTWETRVGTVSLKIPKLREGSFFPSLLEPRRRAERALLSVVQEAYVHGVSTRKVDIKVRENNRVQSMAVVIAIGVRETGEREVLGIDLGPGEDAAFWLAFLRSLVARGLTGVKLVISDAHDSLRQAIGAVLTGAAWQRCRVHFMRNLLAHIPKGAQSVVAAAVRMIFLQPDLASAKSQLRQVAASLERKFPRAAQILLDAEDEILACMTFPHIASVYIR